MVSHIPNEAHTAHLTRTTGFATAATPSAAGRAAAGVRRAGTVVRSPLDRKERKGATDGDMSAADVCFLSLIVSSALDLSFT